MLGGFQPVVGVQFIVSGAAMASTKVARLRSGVAGMASSLEKSTDTWKASMEDWQQMAYITMYAGFAMSVLGGAALAASAALSKAAIPYEQVATAASGLAKATGTSDQTLQAFTKSMHDNLFTQTEALQTANKLMGVEVDLADKIILGAIANDIATAKAMDRSKVLDALTDAIVRGNAESLTTIDIGVSAERMWQAYSQKIYGVVQPLTTAEKRQAAWNYIVDMGTKFHGAFAATTDTLNYQLQVMRVRIDDLKLGLGVYVNATLKNLLKVINPVLDYLSRMPPLFKAITANALIFGGILLSIGAALAILKPAIAPLMAALGKFPQLMQSWAMTKPLALAVPFKSLFTAITSSIKPLITAFDIIPSKVKLIAAAVGLLVTAFVKDFGGIRSALDQLVGGFNNVAAGIRMAFVGIAATVWAAIRPIVDLVSQTLQALDQMVRKFTGKLGAENFGIDFATMVRNFFIGGASMGGAIVAGMIQGITAGIRAIRQRLELVNRNLSGHSPPPEGPLKDVDMGGYRLIEAWIAGMVSYPLDEVEALADRVERSLRRALWPIQDALFDLDTQLRKLDSALWPLEDELTLIEAQAKLVTIPLERQLRPLRRQRDELEKILDLEERRQEKALQTLRDQRDLLQEQVDLARERFEVLDHELFIEEVKNKIRRQETSGLALVLRSRRMEAEDALAEREAELEALRKTIDSREKEFNLMKEMHREQLDALDRQIEAIEKLVQAEEDRVTWAQEELELARARQAEERLAIEQQRRVLEDQERLLNHMLDIVGRVNDLLDRQEKQAKEAVDTWDELVGVPEMPVEFEAPKLDFGTIFADIDQLSQDIADAFMGPITEAWDELKKEWELLTKEWEDLKVNVEVTLFTEGPIELLKRIFTPEFNKNVAKDIAKLTDALVVGFLTPGTLLVAPLLKKLFQEGIIPWWNEEAFPWLRDAIGQLFSPDTFTSALGDVGTPLGAIANLIANQPQYFQDWFASIKTGWEKDIIPWWNTEAVPWFQGAWNDLQTWLNGNPPSVPPVEEETPSWPEWLTNAQTSFDTWVKNMGQGLSAWWESVKTSVSTTATSVETAIGTWGENVKTSFNTWVSNMGKALDDWWESVKTGVSTTATNVGRTLTTWGTSITTWWNNFKTSISTTAENLKTDLSTKFEAAKTAINNAWGGVVNFWNGTVIPAINTLWNKFKDDLIPTLTGPFVAAIEGVKSAWNSICTFWNETLSKVLEDIKTYINDHIIKVFSDLGSTILSGPKAALDKMKDALEALKDPFEKAKGWAQGLIDKFSQIKVPSSLEQGSPSEMELALRAVSAELKRTYNNTVLLSSGLRNLRSLPSTLAAGSRVALLGGGGGSSSVTYNYITNEGPRIDLQAHYARTQSLSSLRADVELLARLI